MHLYTPLQVRGPLKRSTATFAGLGEPAGTPCPKASTNIDAILISAFQPFLPKLPLPSSRTITSRELLHGIVTFGAVGHPIMLQFLYSKRAGAHLSGHVPSPSGGAFTPFVRFWVPPSQSLEHLLHAVHSWSSQSFSHAKVLHDLV